MTSFSINHPMPLAVTVIVVGTRCTCDVSQSITTSKQSKLFDFGSGPIKSNPIDCHGLSGIGRLCSRPIGLLFASLLVMQIPQDLQYDSMSCDIDCHQKCLLMYWAVLNCPKWPIILCA